MTSVQAKINKDMGGKTYLPSSMPPIPVYNIGKGHLQMKHFSSCFRERAGILIAITVFTDTHFASIDGESVGQNEGQSCLGGIIVTRQYRTRMTGERVVGCSK